MLSIRNKARFMSVFAILAMLFSFIGVNPVAAASDISVTSITLETRRWNGHVPTNSTDAVNTYFALPLGIPGYATAAKTLTNFNSVSNQITFGGTNSNIGYHHHFAFNAPLAGTLALRMGADFGFGGTLLIDGILVEFRNNDMWWNGNYSTPTQYLKGTVTIAAGPHVIDSYGFEGCCDGPQQAQYSYLGDPYKTFQAPANNVPVVSLTGLSSVPAGSASTYNFTVSDTDPGATFTVTSVSCGVNGSQAGTTTVNATGGSFPCSFTDSSIVSVMVTDNLGAQSNTATLAVTVLPNIPPTASAGGPYYGTESFSIVLNGSGSFDPDGNPLTYNWTVSDPGVCTFDDPTTENPNLMCIDNGDFPTQITVDDGTASDNDNTVVYVSNLSPQADLGNDSPINEGDYASVSFSNASDPSSIDTAAGFHYAFECNGDFPFAATYATSGSSDSTNCSFADNGNFDVAGNIMDKDGGYGSSDTTVMVNNVAPTITSLVAGAVAACGQSNSLTINFTDPALMNDTYTAIVNWGDASSTTYASVSSGFSPSHAYALAGMYTATVTVSDEDGGTSLSSSTTLTLNYAMVGSGVQQPINQDGSSVFKFKSTIPVKLKVTDCNGSTPGALTIKIMLTQLNGNAPGTDINEPFSTSAADTTGFMRFTGSPDNQYIYNLTTKSLPDSTATYKITLTIMQTGQTVTVNFGLKP